MDSLLNRLGYFLVIPPVAGFGEPAKWYGYEKHENHPHR
jgi:hypothetical protein